ncbi:MAG: DinB family protein [Brevibacterium sp.]|nr:DinB family protein [Brevibacterium sp.]
MPFFAPSVTTEPDALFSFLEQQCTQLKLTALGLTDDQARSTPTASSLSISGLVAHAAQVINGWLQQVKEPTRHIDEEEYPTINDGLGLNGMFDGSGLPDLDIAEVIAIFEKSMTEIDVARQSVADNGIDLGTVVATPGNPWMPKDFVMNVRWILCHLNTEIARHAGHADIIRESIDGSIAYQLNAQADGQPWPPEEWS